MKICKLLSALTVSVLIPLQAYALENNQYEVWIQQDGKAFPATSPIKLKRAPFEVVFRGPAANDYGLAAATKAEELPKSGDLSSVFRFGNGLFVDDPNTKISISAPGVIGKGWSSWNMWAYSSPNDPEYISGFQKRAVNADGTVLLTRTIDKLCVDDGEKDACHPVSKPVYKRFFALVTTLPPLLPGQKADATRWLNPTTLEIEFTE